MTGVGQGLAFSLADADRELVKRVSQFGRAAVAPAAEDRIRERRFDMALWGGAAQLGLTGMSLEPGGQRGILRACLALEALQASGSDSGLSLSLAAHLALCLAPLVAFGSKQQRERYVPALASGEAIGGLAITEPGHGSDATGIETTARPTGGGFRLDGVKTYVTNGSLADVLVVLARTGDGDLGFGLTAFLVEPRSTAGVRAEDLHLSGYRSTRISRVELDGAEVGPGQVLGRLGAGFHTVARRAFELERSVMLGPVVGDMQRCLDECVAFASSRRSAGYPIAAHGQVQRRLADMKARLESARWAVYRAAWGQDAAVADSTSGPVAKKVVSEGALANAADAMQVMGAAGAHEHGPVARTLHDARLAGIAGGTIELQEQALVAAMIDQRDP